MKRILTLTILLVVLTFCAMPPTQSTPFDKAQGKPTTVPVHTPGASMPNPASVYCEKHGNKLEIRTAADGGQQGVCVFADGSECDEWAYYRGECGPGVRGKLTVTPAHLPTTFPTDSADYQGWWTYTHAAYNFSIKLPADWVVALPTANDALMQGHLINLHPRDNTGKVDIRMTFRRVGEDVLLWPTGVGQGDFTAQGTLDVAGQPAQRVLFVCPGGAVTAIWYHQDEGQPNLVRGNLEFSFIFSAGSHCEAGYSIGGKVQRWGELIIASLKTA